MFLKKFVKAATVIAVSSALLTLSCGSSSDNAFVPSREGAILTSLMLDSDGMMTGATRTTVRNVNRSGQNMTVTTVTQVLDEDGAVKSTIEETLNVVDGVAEIDIGSQIAAMVGLPRSAASGSDKLRLPSNMKVGDLFGDIRMNLGGVDISITNFQCVSIEEITVPAGTFNRAYKMKYNINIRRAGNRLQPPINITNSITDWFVKGIGNVKTEIANSSGSIEGTGELVEIARNADESSMTHFFRAMTYLANDNENEENINRAIAELDLAIQRNNDNYDAYLLRSFLYSEKEDYIQEIKDLDQVIRIMPDYAGAFFNRGMANHELGNFSLAIADFEEALRLDSTFSDDVNEALENIRQQQ